MLRELEAQARAVKQKIQRREAIGAVGREREEEDEDEEVDMEDDGEAGCGSANSETVRQTVAGLKALSTARFNKPLRLNLTIGGFDQKSERLAGTVVETLCPPLGAADFVQVVAAVTNWRTDKGKLVFKQRTRDVSGRIREDLNTTIVKARAADPTGMWVIPEAFSQKTLTSNLVFKAIKSTFTDSTGLDFPSIPFTVLGMIEFGEIIGVCSDTFENLTSLNE
jgi:hypothetical protein